MVLFPKKTQSTANKKLHTVLWNKAFCFGCVFVGKILSRFLLKMRPESFHYIYNFCAERRILIWQKQKRI